MTQGGRTINTSANTSPLARLAGVALDTLLPPQCPACGEVVEAAGTLCGPCWRRVDFLGDPQCSACGLPFEFDPGPVDGPGDAILCGGTSLPHGGGDVDLYPCLLTGIGNWFAPS